MPFATIYYGQLGVEISLSFGQKCYFVPKDLGVYSWCEWQM